MDVDVPQDDIGSRGGEMQQEGVPRCPPRVTAVLRMLPVRESLKEADVCCPRWRED